MHEVMLGRDDFGALASGTRDGLSADEIKPQHIMYEVDRLSGGEAAVPRDRDRESTAEPWAAACSAGMVEAAE